MGIYKCPKCKRIYNNDNIYYCMNCNQRLISIEKESSIEHCSTSTQQQCIPKCPTCGSTDIRKIGSVERGASIFTFGLFSKKINKTFKCNNCGYTW